MKRHYALAVVAPFVMAGLASAATITQTLNSAWGPMDTDLVAYGSITIPDAVASIDSFTVVMAHGWDQDLDITINGFDGVSVFMMHDLMFFDGDGSMIGDGLGEGLANTDAYTFVSMGTPGAITEFGGPGTIVSPGGIYEANEVWTPTTHAPNTEFILAVRDLFEGYGGAVESWSIEYTPLPGPGALALLGLAGLVSGGRRRV